MVLGERQRSNLRKVKENQTKFKNPTTSQQEECRGVTGTVSDSASFKLERTICSGKHRGDLKCQTLKHHTVTKLILKEPIDIVGIRS